MTLTPQEIHSKEFTSRGRGFDKTEVNDFLDQVVIDFETLINENQTLKTKLAESEANVKQVEDMKQSVNSSILIAQEAAERLKKQTEAEVEATRNQAEEQAQQTVLDATAKANTIVTTANEEAAQTEAASAAEIAKLKSEKEALTQEMAGFKAKLTGMLQNQIDLVNGDHNWTDVAVAAEKLAPAEATTEANNNKEAAQIEKTSTPDSSALSEEEFEAAVQAKLAEFSEKEQAENASETVVVFPEADSESDKFLN
ncbi:DivIVA domain-containing protein [Weissella diestrammenae]|uniref:DivIVA domain-containing protein n=1 Tax=Weissella diestrammenae TaxID=1162633 RepID=A0A7G9T630_9LACO|nr:DivIVA domain-containing protein [Weissella diestrammenae]MCM0582390.1 DivIVA domain-containing protein [Weissella diestrammenae]QNN75555.1 DivIVA domain-containing protein [Weissella diestrammenae]